MLFGARRRRLLSLSWNGTAIGRQLRRLFVALSSEKPLLILKRDKEEMLLRKFYSTTFPSYYYLIQLAVQAAAYQGAA